MKTAAFLSEPWNQKKQPQDCLAPKGKVGTSIGNNKDAYFKRTKPKFQEQRAQEGYELSASCC